MVDAQEKTAAALKLAIQMESDGKEFYLKAGRESTNDLGKKLFESLAAEEDIHRQRFEAIYKSIQDKRGWPDISYEPDGGRGLRTIFSQSLDTMAATVAAQVAETDAVQTAIDMESKTFDLYTMNAASATYDAEREFYQALAMQEREHQLVLLDYYEFLKDPASWYVNKEHQSLDGG